MSLVCLWCVCQYMRTNEASYEKAEVDHVMYSCLCACGKSKKKSSWLPMGAKGIVAVMNLPTGRCCVRRRRVARPHVVQIEHCSHRVCDAHAVARREGADEAVGAARGGDALPVAVQVELDRDHALRVWARPARPLRRRHVHVVQVNRR
eukprot:5055058-Pleurochrysis_carterae.AAC.3